MFIWVSSKRRNELWAEDLINIENKAEETAINIGKKGAFAS